MLPSLYLFGKSFGIGLATSNSMKQAIFAFHARWYRLYSGI